MGNRRWLFAALWLVAGRAAADYPGAVVAQARLDHAAHARYQVIRTIDGDSLECIVEGKPQKIGLACVEAPKLIEPPAPSHPYAKESAEALRNLLSGEAIWFEPHEEGLEDGTGRALGYVWRVPDGLFVNLEVLRQGYGKVVQVLPTTHKELFAWAEDQAKTNVRGLWATNKNAKPVKPEVLSALLASAQALMATGDAKNAKVIYGYVLAMDPTNRSAADALRAPDPVPPPPLSYVTPTAPPPAYTPPAAAPSVAPGACPQGGPHTPGRTDRDGHLHCSKCGRYM